MKWIFKCPFCDNSCKTEWDYHGKNSKCPHCKKEFVIPSPKDQHSARVDQHDWPKEMEDEVLKTKGKTCIIKGCKSNDITLDHIIAWENKGPTSVDNLQPMCQSHNSSKGKNKFSNWLKENSYTTR